MGNMTRYKKYEANIAIKASGVFFDTNDDRFIVEYSNCKEYFRILTISTFCYTGWLGIIGNTGLRITKDNSYWYNGNGNYMIKFPVWKNLKTTH